MSSPVKNAWREKAEALDRYRWRMLRERHGLSGSLFRFIRDAFIDFGFGLAARWRLTDQAQGEPGDFLLLQSAPRIIALRRKKLLIAALQDKGYRFAETAIPEFRDILSERQLARPVGSVPIRYFGYAAHAAWIVEHYQPRILLNDRNGSLYSPFLRVALHQRNGLLVHLAHATTVERSRRLGMNDYDYYFLFGSSSLNALAERRLRFGTSTAVLTGSHMIDQSYDLAPPDPQHRTLLILGVGPDKEKEAGYQRTYQLLRDWAAQNPQYQVLVKSHPRSSVPFWSDAEKSLSNVSVLPKECTLAQALEKSSCVVNIMSNAVIEAALAARPVIYCNLSDDRDIFRQEDFFGPAVCTVADFDNRIQQLEQDFPARIERAKEFAFFHLAHGSHGLEKTLETLENLHARAELPDDVESAVLPDTV